MKSVKLWRVSATKTNGIELITWYYDTQEAIQYAIKMQDDLSVNQVSIESV